MQSKLGDYKLTTYSEVIYDFMRHILQKHLATQTFDQILLVVKSV